MDDRILGEWVRERAIAKQVCKKAMDISTRKTFTQLVLNKKISAVWITVGDQIYILNYPYTVMSTLDSSGQRNYGLYDEKYFVIVNPTELEKVEVVSNGYILTMPCISIHELSEVK